MKKFKYLMVITKNGNTEYLSFKSEEFTTLKFKLDYFSSKFYLIEIYTIVPVGDDIVLQPFLTL